jgi:formylglycine-generating enzyme required for sulfatase activity
MSRPIRRDVIFGTAILLLVLGEAAFAQRKQTHTEWAEAVIELRETCSTWHSNENAGLNIGPWFESSHNGRISPTDTIDLTSLNQEGKRIWHPTPELIDGVVHYDLSNHGISTPRHIPEQEGNRIAASEVDPIGSGEGPASRCLVRTIESPDSRNVTIWLGTERGLDVWLNGKRVFADARMGDGMLPERDQAEIVLPLREGENQLVLRFLDVRRSGFYFSTLSTEQLSANPLSEMLAALEETYPIAYRQAMADTSRYRLIAWMRYPQDELLPGILLDEAISGLGEHNLSLREKLEVSRIGDIDSFDVDSPQQGRATIYVRSIINNGVDIKRLLRLYEQAALFRKAWSDLRFIDFPAMRRAVEDLTDSYPDRFADADRIYHQLDAYESRMPGLIADLEEGNVDALHELKTIDDFRRRTLLANPLLDFDQIIAIRRTPLGDPRRAEAPNRGMGEFLGLAQQSAWQLDRIRQPFGWDNDIVLISSLRSKTSMQSLYRPPTPRLISDIELDFDNCKLSFSMPGEEHRWRVFEMNLENEDFRQITPNGCRDVDDFDACYLPNGKMVFVSTAAKQGVPCSNGIAVAVNYLMDADGSNIRRLGFDQDHDYCPTVMNDGRVMYLRWDYTDLPHQWPRILFAMNPDGTGQRAIYGSNSYWPNAIFNARPIPDHPSKVLGVITGHHVGRVGELILFDLAQGQHEADGVVQRIPGWGEEVEPIIMDKLTIDSWPKFVHPYPLSDKYFLVSGKPGPDDLWGIYLVDVFDNMVLLEEIEGEGLFEPMPRIERERPPIIPDRVDPESDEAIIYLSDIYDGEGLRGVPRGSVKSLRIFAYNFAYPYKSGGQHRVGTDGPWEPKRILGTVPVEEDGSAVFRVPAETPISIQALDERGAAIQLMRSWTTAMPGEIVSCVGCHEGAGSAPSARMTMASTRPPSEIEPWYGPARGFSFSREVQPVLDAYCVSCHDGRNYEDGDPMPDLRGNRDSYVVLESNNPQPKLIESVPREELVQQYSGVFEPAYYEMRRFVRVGGLESDLHVLKPGEFHADTTELMQILEKDHYGVQLDDESYERLAAWIDLNAPCHGSWQEVLGRPQMAEDHERRIELESLYGSIAEDLELTPVLPAATIRPLPARDAAFPTAPVFCGNWPLSVEEAIERQSLAGTSSIRTLNLGHGVTLGMVLIPAGEYVMGDPNGHRDERPVQRIEISNAFWISRCEITNEQFARFNSTHDSRHEHGTASFNSERAIGPPLNGPRQPVVRVSWEEASNFCDWASERSGLQIDLPTEVQWEYACRAGSGQAFHWGDQDDDFSPYANMADATLNTWATYNERRRSADQVPREERFDDNALVTVEVGSYRPNAWGLHDMHGNVWEWTRSNYLPYSHKEYANKLESASNSESRKVARGGSWYDSPHRCNAAYRLSYPQWRKVYNVGFRVVLEQQPSGNAG